MNNLENAASLLGRKGGLAGTGIAKARNSEKARKAAYTRWNKHWADPIKWLEERVDKNSETVCDGSRCWEWKRAIVPKTGYGHAEFAGKQFSAHRLAWIAIIGPIPEGRFVLHKCNNKRCCNPDHLYLGDNTDNMRQASRDGLLAFGEKNCKSKLNQDKVRAIKEHYSIGISQTEISRRFGVTQGTISDVLNCKTWRHVS